MLNCWENKSPCSFAGTFRVFFFFLFTCQFLGESISVRPPGLGTISGSNRERRTWRPKSLPGGASLSLSLSLQLCAPGRRGKQRGDAPSARPGAANTGTTPPELLSGRDGAGRGEGLPGEAAAGRAGNRGAVRQARLEGGARPGGDGQVWGAAPPPAGSACTSASLQGGVPASETPPPSPPCTEGSALFSAPPPPLQRCRPAVACGQLERLGSARLGSALLQGGLRLGARRRKKKRRRGRRRRRRGCCTMRKRGSAPPCRR